MVKQYPDHIEVKITGKPYQDENGNWVPGETVLFESECRAEPNSGNVIIRSESGEDIRFDFKVYMPLTSTVIPTGASVKIIKHDGREIKSTIKRPSNGQLNSRLWV